MVRSYGVGLFGVNGIREYSCSWYVLFVSDGHTTDKMRVIWKKGFDESKVTENNSISLAQFEYGVSFDTNYEEEIASGESEDVVLVRYRRH